MAMVRSLLLLSMNKLKFNNMKNLYIIMLIPTLMFGQIKQVNTVFYDDAINSGESSTLLEQGRQEAINIHNTIRKYQSIDFLEYDDNLSQTAQEWANVIIDTGNFDFDPNLPSGMGQNLFSIEQQQANTISNYNPYLDAALYWATTRGGDGISYGNMCTPIYSSIGMGVAYGNGEIVVVAKYK